MDQLLIHPQTRNTIEAFLASPSHALMLVGLPGSGKKTVAELIAINLLKLKNNESLKLYPYLIRLERRDAKQEISIDSIRQLAGQLKLRTTGSGTIRRVILIIDAEYMSLEAQNAMLKILEQPPADSLFILTTASKRSVLPTIASRAQIIELQPISLTMAKRYYTPRSRPADIESAWQLSNGQVGLLGALLAEDRNHPLKAAVEQAKDFLRQKPYKRLLMLDRLMTSRDDFLLFLSALEKIVRALHHNHLEKNDLNNSRRLLRSRCQIEELKKAAVANVLPRVLILKLVNDLEL
jgi:replication-associated recombination protein RarA